MSIASDTTEKSQPIVLGAPIAVAANTVDTAHVQPSSETPEPRSSDAAHVPAGAESRPAGEFSRTPPKTSAGEPAVIRGMIVATESDLAHLENPYEGGYSHTTGVPSTDAVAAAHAHEEELRKERELEQRRLIPGFDNDDLNALLRAFDKLVHNAHAALPPYDAHIPAGLDLQPVEDEEFTLDKLRSALERFYATFVAGVIRLVHEFMRIRRWEDGGTRTAVSLSVYVIAWHNDLILTTLLLFLGILVLFPSARSYCYARPDAPYPWGPAASEQKASSWAGEVEELFLSVAKPSKTSKTSKTLAGHASDRVREKIDGDMETKEEQGEKEPEEGKHMKRSDKVMELYGQPTMRIIGGLADKWERIANAIAPAPEGYLEPRRGTVFCLLILPLLPVTTFVPGWVFSRAFGAAIGLLVFGKPVTDRALEYLDEHFPDWKMDILLKNNILSEVPTNAQLVLRILRDREHRRHPIPLPSDEIQSESHHEERDSGDTDRSTTGKLKDAGTKATQTGRNKLRRALEKTGKWKEEASCRKECGFLTAQTFARITGHKHTAHSGHGVQSPGPDGFLDTDDFDEASPDTPSRFYVHHEGHGPGHLIIHPPRDAYGPSTALVELTTLRPSGHVPETMTEHSPKHFVAPLNDIVGLKKKGLGWTGRLVASALLGTTGTGGNGMEIEVIRRDTAQPGATVPPVETIRLKGIVRRNELFDRLLAMGDQRWNLL